jgi:hypothetical protein
MRGISESGCSPKVEMHFPETQAIRSEVQRYTSQLGVEVQEFAHASMAGGGDKGVRYAWLLSQLSAMDTAPVLIAAAGNPDGSASMLLHLAESRRHSVLPFGHLGGAASLSLERQRYSLGDRLEDLYSWLQDPRPIDRIDEALKRLVAPVLQPQPSDPEPTRFFISYPRERFQEADLVENHLRRRNLEVFRDDQAFDPSGDLQQEIREAIHKADVFISLWCAEYACSPWCFDEIDLALELRSGSKLKVWILMLDNTRVVPPGARGLIFHNCKSREALQQVLTDLIDRDDRSSGRFTAAECGFP